MSSLSFRALRAVLMAGAMSVAAARAGAQEPAPTRVRPTPAALAASIDSLADSLTRGAVAGMSVVVARGPDVLLAKGYGFADVEANRPASAQTVYQIGSVTKQFTAAAVMRLVEQGRLALDDPITRYLPDFDPQGHTVTVRHLLNHTSGIRSYTSFLPPDDSLSVRQVYEAIVAQPFDFVPGADWRYNNSGYLLLGMIIETVTGRPYAELVQEWFFTPLGMNDTRYCGAGGSDIPSGYRPGLAGARMRVPPVDMRVPFAAGALCSTAPDLARWAWGLATGRVVTPESYRAMTSGTTLTTGRRLGYGFGIAADTVDGRLMISHGGSIPGFLSNLVLFPADSTIVVVLLNTQANMAPISQRIVRAALGVAAPKVEDRPIPADVRRRVSGTYALTGAGIDIRVFEEGDALMAQGSGQGAFRLLWQGGGEFRASFDPDVRLVFPAAGPADGFVLHQGGGTVRASRRE